MDVDIIFICSRCIFTKFLYIRLLAAVAKKLLNIFGDSDRDKVRVRLQLLRRT